MKIEVSELTRRYGDFVAVDRISFAVDRGEVVGYLGPNGAAKSTTVKMLTGILQPTSGRILIDGQDLQDHTLSIKQRKGDPAVGSLAQSVGCGRGPISLAVAGLLADGFPIQKLTPGRPGIQWNKIGAASDRAYEPDFQPGDRSIAQGGRGRNIFLLRGYVWLLNDHAGHVDPDGVRAGGHFAG